MIAVDVKVGLSYSDGEVLAAVEEKLGEKYSGKCKILRRELEIDRKNAFYKLRVGIELDEYAEIRLCKKRIARECPSLEISFSKKRFENRPVVVGSGPCGLFAALALSEAGACPIIIERGGDMDSRKKKVSEFERGGELDSECNVQFGEGGAGTFSDGKLKHGAMDRYIFKVLSEFVAHGAPEDILIDSAPHVGTDLLSGIIKKIRKKIISLGGEFRFNTKLCGFLERDGRVVGVKLISNGKESEILSDRVVIAIGHSARDTFKMLDGAGLCLEARGFGVGVRIEHPRKHIDRMIYGDYADDIGKAASYHFVTHLKNGRSVYSFCMCPGGSVVAATSERGAVVTNGMSLHARDGENSNAAFLVSVTPNDFGNQPLMGLEFQSKLEKQAFSVGGGYKAPCVRMEDFMAGQKSSALGSVSPTYPRGVTLAKPSDFLPDFVESSLRLAIPDFDEYRKGFYLPDALMTGIETRTTSPVRILRDEKHEARGLRGVYPCGEGAGYSGGIISSAVDGLKTAEQMLMSGF